MAPIQIKEEWKGGKKLIERISTMLLEQTDALRRDVLLMVIFLLNYGALAS